MEKSTVGTDRVKDLALELRLLNDCCVHWLAAWRVLPERLLGFKTLLSQFRSSTNEEVDLVNQLVVLLHPLALNVQQKRLLPGDLLDLRLALPGIVGKLQKQPGYRLAGSLYSELHCRLENLVYLLTETPADLATRAERCLLRLEETGRPETRLALLQMTEAAQKFDPEALAFASQTVEAELPFYSMEPLPLHRALSSYVENTNWVLLAVEDDPLWQQAIERAVNLLKMKLEPRYTLRLEVRGDYHSALALVQELTARSLPSKGATARESGLLAVLDIGLPLRPDTAPSREAGIQLLRELRKPAVNVPTLVLTTKPNFLGDHQFAYELGVGDYLLKGSDSEESLYDALLRMVTVRPQHTVQVLEETERRLRVDDVEVALDPMVFRTISVLADEARLYNRPHPVTLDCMLHLLQDKFRGYMHMPDLERGLHWVNVSKHWRKAQREMGRQDAAVAWLEETERYRLWRDLLPEFMKADVDLKDRHAVADYLESNYGGGTHSEDYSLENLEKHIFQARDAVKRAFNAVGKTIVPEEELLVNTQVGNQFAYKFVANVLPLPDTSRDQEAKSLQTRVLVVENDVEIWQQPICDLLFRYHYKIETATSVQEAVVKAAKFKPDILCLDMHIPLDQEAFAREPLSGAVSGGLDALERIVKLLPEVRAIVLTDLADRDDLRTRAERLGVRVVDFVPKRHSREQPWETDLVLRLHRIEQELQRQAVLPLPSSPYLPFVHIVRQRSEEMYVEVFGKRWNPTVNQYKLLMVLAENSNCPVPTEKVVDSVYGLNGMPLRAEYDNKLKQLVKKFRECIWTEWLQMADKQLGSEAAKAVLMNDAKNGYILNARVSID